MIYLTRKNKIARSKLMENLKKIQTIGKIKNIVAAAKFANKKYNDGNNS